MADYFTKFSVLVPLPDVRAREYALNLAAQAADLRHGEEPVVLTADLSDALEDWSFETDEQKEGLWLHSESGGVEAACAFIRHLLQQFDPAGRVTFEWSHDCSQPRVDAYGGGAAIVTARNIATLSTSTWLMARERRTAAQRLQPPRAVKRKSDNTTPT